MAHTIGPRGQKLHGLGTAGLGNGGGVDAHDRGTCVGTNCGCFTVKEGGGAVGLGLITHSQRLGSAEKFKIEIKI